ncbi:hypothetical protein [Mobiluncus curtisii]|uniref:Tripeptidyl aminopeptidase n=1 Tax=Mobiluncus curtisii TaxID=2051 RepID=A0A2X3BIQ2_9ACTO|nr:hypothetical protein [Mobiluncus curtisii]SQC01557.1 Tripeptidyl aminopeptidase precursor [Mobiluncus curtisii]
MNPGGPGGSGLENMKPENVAYFFSDTVRKYYDVLGFDPRGVGVFTARHLNVALTRNLMRTARRT